MALKTTVSPQRGKGGLGTFAGVFTPSVLTILGIILFRRLGYVVGYAGLAQALIIVGLSSAISVLTAISLSAIATNLKVKGGGDYYLISRTLGVEFGGAIGIVLFLAQSVSIAFYCIGFAEVVSSILPADGQISTQITSGLAVALLFIFAWLGADWATRLQYVIMAVLAAALVSFFFGGLIHWDGAFLTENWSAPPVSLPFWLLFAIFFPAVTGFTQGVSMSGDLKDAGKSLPLGTFLAVGISILVYFGAAIVFAASMPAQELTRDYEAMKRVARINWLVDAGVIAATLSSAMASFLGAPRILQSIARDRIFPWLRPFAEGAGESENPRCGVLFSAGIAVAAISMGNLNFIAPVVSMFFLISYGLLNYATFSEARSASPSFRPRFHFFDARLSLLGALGCLGAMLAINPGASVAALAVLFAIHQYLKRTAGPARWADSQHSYHFQRIRENLLSMAAEPEHPRGWRPCILAFCDDRERRNRLLRFASWIEGGSGLTTAVQIIEGEGAQSLQLRDKARKELQDHIEEEGLKIFSRTLAAPDFRVGVEALLQSFGIGSIRANMVLLSKADQLHRAEENEGQIRYGRELQEAIRLGCNVVVLDSKEAEWAAIEESAPEQRLIDVWWWGDKTSHLMLLLAYLMTRSEEWSDAKIRVLAPSSEKASEKTLASLRQTLEEVRIDAQPEALLDLNLDKVGKYSRKSSLVFFPLRFKQLQILTRKDNVDRLLERLPVVAFTLAAEDIDLGAGPEEGEVAENAAALDAASDAEQEAVEAEKKASELATIAEQMQREVNKDPATGISVEEQTKAKTALREAEELAAQALRRAEEARARALAAAKEAEALAEKPVAIGDKQEASKTKDGL